MSKSAKKSAKVSKFLSLVLRHQPEAIGLRLDAEGWVRIAELLPALAQHGYPVSVEELHTIVRENDKQRFAIQEDRIRANQGHSIEIALQLEPREPPDVLYHGTATRYLGTIWHSGLQKMQRQHVHLSRDADTARQVGARHGKPAILRVQAGTMARAGHVFYRSANGVWLTAAVPALYLEPMDVT